ncbi:Myosin-2B [Diplonema papillatum]|nr:Myosin-2B [Diplonema papillatum]
MSAEQRLADRPEELAAFADGGGRAPEGPAVDLVDLFGFEDFAPRNRLEQLLVNYANERLQAFHYQQRFGALADQCRRENVAFEPPRHEGNAGCVRLLDGPKGVLGILEDEAARGPLETSDAGFLDKLFAAFTGPMGQRLNPYFGKPKSPAAAAAMFNISHYAGEVSYSVAGAIRKNQRQVRPELFTRLESSSAHRPIRDFLRFARAAAPSDTPALSKIFRAQLSALLASLAPLRTHWIRCVKPNAFKRAGSFAGGDVLRQVRATGVLPVIRLLQAGPAAFPFREFADEFGAVLAGGRARDHRGRLPPGRDLRAECADIMAAAELPASEAQVGALSLAFATGRAVEALRGMVHRVRLAAVQRLVRVSRGAKDRVRCFIDSVRSQRSELVKQRAARQAHARRQLELRDRKRREHEAADAAATAAKLAQIDSRLSAMSRLEADRRAYRNHVQSELSTWSRSVIASQKQWQASHAEWCTDREVEAKAETALLSAHQKAHDARLAALEQKRRRDQAWAEAKLTRKAEAAAAESDRRRALAGQRNRDGYKRALVEEEYQAARECQREMRRNRRIIEEELRLEAELSREKAASKLQKSRDRIAEAQRSRALLSFERRSAELRKSARELEFEAKKNAWQAAETEQAALILSALNTPGGEATLLADAASSPQAAVLLRDVQRAASMS